MLTLNYVNNYYDYIACSQLKHFKILSFRCNFSSCSHLDLYLTKSIYTIFYSLEVTKTARADILFPVARVRNQMKAGGYAKSIGTTSAVYMAAVLEYLASEMLSVAGDVAKENNKRRINPRHLTLGVRNDDLLDELLKNVTIADGGVAPSTLQELLRKHNQNQAHSEEL